jgi:hypothetical protein
MRIKCLRCGERKVETQFRAGEVVCLKCRDEVYGPCHLAAVTPEPEPQTNDRPAVWGLVVDDMRARDAMGAAKYGTRLQPHNGRDALADAYQEALDLAVYLRQALFERDGR